MPTKTAQTERQLYDLSRFCYEVRLLTYPLQKPVSSLRSHFENIGSASPVPSISSRASRRFDGDHGHGQKEQGYHGRASLDIPRQTSPWAVTKDAAIHEPQQNAKTMGPPVTPRSERPRSALINRPSSARRTSPPSAPPLVTVVSPKSPPKSTHLSHASSVPHLPTPKYTSANGLGSRPAPPVPPHSTRTINQLPVQIPSLAEPRESRAPVKSPMPVPKYSTSSIVDTPLAIPPPPVNRADKPKIPLKSSTRKTLSILDPSAAVNDERISPFSTPPSSDESPNHISTIPASKISQPSTTKKPMEKGVSSFNPRTAPEIIQESSIDSGSTSISQINRTHAPRKITGYTEEIRPGLPPRRTTEQGPQPQTLRAHEGRIASTSRIGRQVSQPVPVNQVAPPSASRIVPLPSQFLPPPKRNGSSDDFELSQPPSKTPSPMPDSNDTTVTRDHAVDLASSALNKVEFPDASQTNRRPPVTKQGVHEIDTNYDTRLFEFCGDYLCTTGYLTRAWNLSTGSAIMNLGHGEQTKVTAVAFKPGATAEEEGLRLWMGTNFGDLYEVDIPTQSVVSTKSSAHSRREVVKIHRCQNSIWTLDDGGNLHVWLPEKTGLPNLLGNAVLRRVPKGHTYSLVIHRRLWLATGKEIRIFNPGSSSDAEFQLTSQPLTQQNVGEVTSGAVISSQHDHVYFGHTDGKVTIYSTSNFSCIGIVNVSVYKISALAGAGDYLWAGYSTGMIYVYDTRTTPWRTKKDWHAHTNPVASILVDRSSVWKSGVLQVASIGTDNAVRLWDGMLEEDWLGECLVTEVLVFCILTVVRGRHAGS